MKEIPLNEGRVALVDDQDYDLLVYLGPWYVLKARSGLEYAQLGLGARQTRRHFLMHRLILLAPPDNDVDHRDRNGLNNQRLNLRFATPSQNHANMIKTGKRSRFKGVWPGKSGYTAMIKKNQQRHYLGHYKTDIEAAQAYDAAALRMFGEFSRINFPNGVPADMQPWGVIRG
jgi:hypothetical protein